MKGKEIGSSCAAGVWWEFHKNSCGVQFYMIHSWFDDSTPSHSLLSHVELFSIFHGYERKLPFFFHIDIMYVDGEMKVEWGYKMKVYDYHNNHIFTIYM